MWRVRPVHTKNDNYKDNDKGIALKIVLNIKELQSPHHSYNDNGKDKQYCWNHFQNIFLQKHWIIQSESILLSWAWGFKVSDERALIINRQYCLLVWTLSLYVLFFVWTRLKSITFLLCMYILYHSKAWFSLHVFRVSCSPRLHLFDTHWYCEILLQFKIVVFYFEYRILINKHFLLLSMLKTVFPA